MADAGTWVCGNCRSINPNRSGHCYKCRVPRALALDPASTSPTALPKEILEDAPAHEQARLARQAGEGWRPTSGAAWVARLGVMLATVATLAYLAFNVWWMLQPEDDALDRLFDQVYRVGIPTLIGVWLLSFIAWGYWQARLTANVPSLGGGWPRARPTSALFAGAIPGYNLYATPGVLRDLITRLSPPGTARVNLVSAWWLALFIAGFFYFAPFLASTPIARVVARLVEDAIVLTLVAILGSERTVAEVGNVIQAAMVMAAAVLAISLVDHLEDLQEGRRAELGHMPVGAPAGDAQA